MRRSATIVSRTKTLMVILLALVLAFDMTPLDGIASAHAATDDTAEQTTDRSQRISDLLAANDYVDGHVMAAVYDRYADTTDWFATQNAGSTETLLSTTADTYASATDDTLADTDGGDGVSVILITNDQMSTADMLDALWDDSRILSVEPDYVVQADQTTSDESDQTDTQVAQELTTLAAQSEPTSTSAETTVVPTEASSIADATGYQWSMDNDGSTDHDGRAYTGFDVNSPNWNTPTENACGVVAIMDTGIDYTNPDLDDVMMTTMDQYNSDGGKYGMDVSGFGDPTDVMDKLGHGTHCAGIVASEWNDFGTSGVANGCKLAAVKVYDSEGALSISSMARGYAYLSKAVDNGLNLVAVNNSWGDRDISKTMSILVTQLGEKGVVSVFSAGNSGVDSDYNPATPDSFKDNPYAIVVGASNRDGSNAYNYGIATTDVLAPGTNILSTALLSSPTEAMSAHYLEETDGSPITKDTFEDTATDQVKVYNAIDATTFECAEADRVGTTDSTYYYEGSTSLLIHSSDLISTDSIYGYPAHPIYLKIPVSQVDGIMANFKLMAGGLSDGGILFYGQMIATVAESDPSDIRWDAATNDYSMDFSSILLKNDYWASKTMYESTSTPQGRNLAVDANGCVTMKLLIGEGLNTGTVPDVYLDGLSVGTSVALYVYMSGTSMAAPAVAGSAAVAALAQGVTSAPDSADAARLARERVTWLKQHVNQYDGRFLDYCSTGGQIDLSVGGQSVVPTIEGTQVQEGSDPTQVLITGSGFGTTTGTVRLAGKDATVVSWQDDGIVVEVPDGLTAGLISVSVTNSVGTCKDAFVLEIPSASNKALFEKDIALPTEFSTTSMDNFILGLGTSLYVFPQDQTNAFYQNDTKITSGYGVFKDLWCYDETSESWTRLASLPEQLNTLSATVHDGTVFVCGTVFDWTAGTARSVLYSYDAASNAWTTLDASKIPYGASIVDVQGQLMVVGGGTQTSATDLTLLTSDNIATLDATTGTVTVVGSLQTPCASPKLAADGSDVYVAQGWEFSHSSARSVAGMQKLSKGASGYAAADITSALPLVKTPLDSSAMVIHGTYSLTETKDGPLISGALAYADDTYATFLDADTFVSSDGGATFTDFGKRAYRAPVYYASSSTTDEWLYTMGTTAYDDDVLILRATRIAEPEPTPTPVSDVTSSAPQVLPDTSDPTPRWVTDLMGWLD